VWLYCKRAVLSSLCLTLLLSGIWVSFRGASAQGDPSWLGTDAPTLSKVVDLPADVTPDDYTINCTKTLYIPKGETASRTVCTYPSPLGVLTVDGQIETGANVFAPLSGPSRQSTFIPSADASVALISLSSPTIGNEVGIYRGLSKADLQMVLTDGQGVYYQVAKYPDILLRDPATGKPLQLNTTDIVFSSNGEWMVSDMPQGGLVRVNMYDLSVKLFAAPIEPSWFLGIANPPLAISNDGNYVAANTDIWGNGNLNVYDLSTCDSQLDMRPKDAVYCAGKNVWQGEALTGQPIGRGLVNDMPGVQHPMHLRFINNDTLSFDARYDVAAGGKYKVAEFVATASGGVQHKLGLLGLGDSYISGQGAFAYTPGSDDSNDTCHLSERSYPFLLGKDYFNSYGSIACSGAQTFNVVGSSKKYVGQANDKIEEQYRDKPNILANFLPGYIYQQEFASNYLPEAMLLSVGGDDVGFADIVKSCVANSGGGTCYNMYEDRAELVQEMNATYPKLVQTYETLREQSGGARLYVVGYPQVAKVGGDCALNVHLNADEVAFAAQLISYLDGIVRQAAQTAGVFYVDTQHAFDGHRLCESGDKAMNGFTIGNDAGVTIDGHTINFIGSESYHPTILGYQLLAQSIAAQTNDLTASMPIAATYAMPQFDPTMPFLTSVPATGRAINHVAYSAGIANDFAVRGNTRQIAVDGNDMQLQPGSTYQVVLHSTPTLLAEGSVDSAGNIATAVQLPVGTDPGYHTLHVYGTNMAGEPVDIQKMLYVAASADDYDGDGVLNNANSCLFVSPTGQDIDQDGIDDSCDPVIAAPKVQAPVSDNVQTTEQAITRTSNVVRAVSPGENVSSSAGVVLGDAVVDDDVLPRSISPSAKGPIAQKLFRLDWTWVFSVGFVLTMGVAALSYRRL